MPPGSWEQRREEWPGSLCPSCHAPSDLNLPLDPLLQVPSLPSNAVCWTHGPLGWCDCKGQQEGLCRCHEVDSSQHLHTPSRDLTRGPEQGPSPQLAGVSKLAVNLYSQKFSEWDDILWVEGPHGERSGTLSRPGPELRLLGSRLRGIFWKETIWQQRRHPGWVCPGVRLLLSQPDF